MEAKGTKAAATLVLAGDIGGTKTDLAVFSSARGVRAPLAQASFASRRYPSLEALVREFLSGIDLEVDRAGFGVAGPVTGGRATITNLPWVMEEQTLARELGIPCVRLFNDLQAVAAAVPLLADDDLHTLSPGRAAAGGAIAVIAPGTGLGEAYLLWCGDGYRAFPSQGGHASFAPADARQAGLLAHLRQRFAHVSCERVCSGMGFPNIFDFLKAREGFEVPGWLAERLAAAEDPMPVIVAAALDEERPCRLCREALETFVAILGAEAGNLALKIMATGGVYLGGGIPRRILPALLAGPFLEAFRRKGRMRPLLEEMPVHVILNPKAALLGAAGRTMDAGRTPPGSR
ncbi:MAG: glucokinase [Desulfobacterales bacterium]|jgi:glucokinase|nr:glucokinase [Desulfobacterales bacterium]